MNKADIRTTLQSLLATKFNNVDDNFIYPDLKTNLQSDFPYVTIVFSDFRLDPNTNRYTQDIHIIGIDHGEDDVINVKKDNLVQNIFQALHKNPSLSLTITGGSDTNLFKPFGLNGGLFPPYCGCRVDATIPNTLSLG